MSTSYSFFVGETYGGPDVKDLDISIWIGENSGVSLSIRTKSSRRDILQIFFQNTNDLNLFLEEIIKCKT